MSADNEVTLATTYKAYWLAIQALKALYDKILSTDLVKFTLQGEGALEFAHLLEKEMLRMAKEARKLFGELAGSENDHSPRY